jgi:hypothetical protein
MPKLLQRRLGYLWKIPVFEFPDGEELRTFFDSAVWTAEVTPNRTIASGGFSRPESSHNHSEFCGVGHQPLVLCLRPSKYATQSL